MSLSKILIILILMAIEAVAGEAAGGAAGGSSGAWAGSGSAISSAGLSMSGNIINDMIQNHYNKQAAQKQYDRNLDMWNKQNEYNSPKAQMARFSAAGLNPNLIYGQGNSGNATPIAPSDVYTPHVPRADYLGKLGEVIALTNAKKQGELLDTQKAVMDQKIIESQAKTLESGTREKLGDIRFRDFVEQLNAKTDKGNGAVDWYRNLYTTQLAALRTRMQLMQKDMQIRDADLTLKGDVHAEKRYYNNLRDTMGVEKGDNIYIRAGMSMFNKAKAYFDQHPQLNPQFKPSIRKK